MRARPVTLLLVLGALLALPGGGCSSTQAQREEQLPPLRDIRSRVPPPVPPDAVRAEDGTPAVQVERLDFPLGAALDAALARLETDALPATIVDAWRNNGLIVGLLPLDQGGAFSGDLPAATGAYRQLTALSPSMPAPLIRSTPLDGPVAVDLTVPPRPVRERVIEGGRVHLLATLASGPTGALQMNLLPHHYVPVATFAARSAAEKELDGRSFPELGLHVPMARTHALVIALRPPVSESSTTLPPPEVDAPPEAEAEPDAAAPTEPTSPSPAPAEEPRPLPARAKPPVVPPHLGRTLCAASRFERPIQMVYVITLAPAGQ